MNDLHQIIDVTIGIAAAKLVEYIALRFYAWAGSKVNTFHDDVD